MNSAADDKDVIDILHMELTQNLPHWLHPVNQFHDQHEAQRKAGHARHAAEQNAKRESKAKPKPKPKPESKSPPLGPLAQMRAERRQRRWDATRARARRAVEHGFDPDEPRDEHGRWTGDGEGDGDKPAPTTGPWSAGLKASGLAAADAAKAEWAKASPIKSVDDLMNAAPKDQNELAEAAKDVEKDTGATFVNPGVKGRDRAEEKIKTGRSPQQITDVVRGGFKVNTPAQADDIVKGLSKQFEVADEGWKRTPAGYFDRAVMVHFKDGVTGEVQLWHPDMFEAKETRGHPIYVLWRSAPPGTTQAKAYEAQMQQIYGDVAARLPREWDQISGRAGR